MILATFFCPILVNVCWTTPILIAGLLHSSGSSPSQFDYPQGVHVDSKQNLHVRDYFNYRLQKFVDESNIGVTIAGISGSMATALNQVGNGIRYFWFDPTEMYIYIADCANHRIMRYLTNSTTGDNMELLLMVETGVVLQIHS